MQQSTTPNCLARNKTSFARKTHPQVCKHAKIKNARIGSKRFQIKKTEGGLQKFNFVITIDGKAVWKG
jgi:hypothetical protein